MQENCRNCGRYPKDFVQVRKNTPFCCESCEEIYAMDQYTEQNYQYYEEMMDER